MLGSEFDFGADASDGAGYRRARHRRQHADRRVHGVKTHTGRRPAGGPRSAHTVCHRGSPRRPGAGSDAARRLDERGIGWLALICRLTGQVGVGEVFDSGSQPGRPGGATRTGSCRAGQRTRRAYARGRRRAVRALHVEPRPYGITDDSWLRRPPSLRSRCVVNDGVRGFLEEEPAKVHALERAMERRPDGVSTTRSATRSPGFNDATGGVAQRRAAGRRCAHRPGLGWLPSTDRRPN